MSLTYLNYQFIHSAFNYYQYQMVRNTLLHACMIVL